MPNLTFPIAGRAGETPSRITRPISRPINTNNPRGNSGGGGGGGGTDPDFASVKLLLKGETANASTPIDSSSVARTMTPISGATVSTAQAKYGNGSVYIPSGATLQAANSADFTVGSGNFTIEFWVRPTSVSGVQALGSYANGSASNSNYAFQLLINGGVFTGSTVFSTTVYTATGGAVTANVWQHVAFVKASGVQTLYVNGVGGTANNTGGAGVNNPSGAVFQLGRAQGFYNFDGYFDEYRFTPGVARYTANFTPPTAAFPTS